jgi:hypothetical protein
LETRPKQLLGYLLLDIALPGEDKKNLLTVFNYELLYRRHKCILLLNRVTKDLKKNSPNFSKSNPKSLQGKKGQNIYNKAQFESPKHLLQTTFETLKYQQQTMF